MYYFETNYSKSNFWSNSNIYVKNIMLTFMKLVLVTRKYYWITHRSVQFITYSYGFCPTAIIWWVYEGRVYSGNWYESLHGPPHHTALYQSRQHTTHNVVKWCIAAACNGETDKKSSSICHDMLSYDSLS